ncbi:MAG: hypothetical protein CVV44_16635 [Spirochaetae bacterium HGW-Spirochaetae-1]|jgi:hypothetical protein|nr:MAG: hypothetical protein CVV44_16635 [Spirochaetae bacterium HGW-Spirochaetae-1]
MLHKSIYVYCNDPSRNIVVLTVTAAVHDGNPEKNPGDARRSRKESLPESEDLMLDLLGVKP